MIRRRAPSSVVRAHTVAYTFAAHSPMVGMRFELVECNIQNSVKLPNLTKIGVFCKKKCAAGAKKIVV